MTHTEIVKKLIGSIQPVGETNTDNERYENLKAMTALIFDLLEEIEKVSELKDRHEFSVKRAGQTANKFLTLLQQG
jgi:hypothetical protein